MYPHVAPCFDKKLQEMSHSRSALFGGDWITCMSKVSIANALVRCAFETDTPPVSGRQLKYGSRQSKLEAENLRREIVAVVNSQSAMTVKSTDRATQLTEAASRPAATVVRQERLAGDIKPKSSQVRTTASSILGGFISRRVAPMKMAYCSRNFPCCLVSSERPGVMRACLNRWCEDWEGCF